MAANGRRPCAWPTLVLGTLIAAFLGPAVTPALGNRATRHGARSHLSHRSQPLPAGPSTPAHRPRAVASVVGGTGVPIARFPFQVALYNPRAGSPAAGFFCGGVIIDASHIATAAHCIATGAHGQVAALGEIEVLAGSTRLTPTDPGSVRDPVVAASFDPRYNPSTSDFDVGVLTLARRLWADATPPSINGVDTIAPLPVDAALAASYAEPEGEQQTMATVSGWGDVNPAPSDAPSYPAGLQAAQVPLVPEVLCGEDYAGIEQTITPRMICAGNSRPRTDSCYGDSGGPLVVDRDSPADPPADYVLVGLVDFGNGCAQPGYPGVYTRIANPEVASFLASGADHRAKLAGRQSRKRRKRHRRH
ncbi:MAG TPA: serine protease [Solirubrobacteraceae bacterium]